MGLLVRCPYVLTVHASVKREVRDSCFRLSGTGEAQRGRGPARGPVVPGVVQLMLNNFSAGWIFLRRSFVVRQNLLRRGGSGSGR